MMRLLSLLGQLAVGLTNLRNLVVVLSVCLLFVSKPPQVITQPIQSVEQWLFRLGLDFLERPRHATKITIIHVSDIEFDRWAEDMVGAKGMSELLRKILAVDDVEKKPTVGILLERPVTLIKPESEALLAEIHPGRLTKDPKYDESKQLFERRVFLADILKSDNVVLGLPGLYVKELPAITVTNPKKLGYPSYVVNWLWPAVPTFDNTHRFFSAGLPHFPLLQQRGAERHLIWQDNSQTNHSFVSAFLSKAYFSPDTTEEIDSSAVSWYQQNKWFPGERLQLHERAIPLEMDGGFLSLYSDFSGLRTSLRQLTLDAALQQETLDGWVLIGRDGSKQLEATAQTLAAIHDGAMMLEPLWWQPILKLLVVVLLLFFTLVVPRLSVSKTLLAVVALSIVLLFFQLYAQIKMQAWISTGLVIVYMFVSWACMSIWVAHTRVVQGHLAHMDDIGCRYANDLIRLSRFDDAFEVVKGCRTNRNVLDTLYKIGEQFESSGRLDKTLVVLRELKKRKRRYQNVHKRVKSLEVFMQTTLGVGQNKLPAAARSGEVAEDGFEKTARITETLTHARTHFGRYEVKRELGRGASGIVYLAHDPTISRDVAIKALNYQQLSASERNDARERFFREAKATGKLNHPNIVQIFDMGEQGDLAYIAMDYARGRPLSDFTSTETLLEPVKVYQIVLEVARALEYAHGQGVIHRDIKPGNILYCQETEQVKVTDLGIAHFIDHSHTRTGEILGSPLYMAPEQLMGKKVNHSSDIFSLGVMFYQLLSGELPFMGDNLASLTYEIIHAKHLSVRRIRRELPASAVRITNTALQKEPAARYRSAHDMIEALIRSLKRDYGVEI